MLKLTKARILAICSMCLISALATPLRAEMRDWTLADGKAHLRADLVNAYDGNVFFMKENGNYIHLPIEFLAQNEIARVILWARERDAKPVETLMQSQGQVAKDLRSTWPGRVVDRKLSDKVDYNVPVPNVFVVVLVKPNALDYPDYFDAIHEAETTLNADGAHFMDVLVLSYFEGDQFREFLRTMSRRGGNWLLTNEWQQKFNTTVWKNYWREPDVTVLVLDIAGNVLCDSSAKNPDGTNQNPGDFLKKLGEVATRMRAGGFSVDNPMLNHDAFQSLLASELANKTTHTGPKPILFDFKGMDPEVFAALDGRSFKVAMEIGTDGLVRNLEIKEGGDPQALAAFKQASMLWHFVPAIKNGIPQVKNVIIPITINVPKTPTPAAN